MSNHILARNQAWPHHFGSMILSLLSPPHFCNGICSVPNCCVPLTVSSWITGFYSIIMFYFWYFYCILRSLWYVKSNSSLLKHVFSSVMLHTQYSALEWPGLQILCGVDCSLNPSVSTGWIIQKYPGLLVFDCHCSGGSLALPSGDILISWL